uniref:ABC transporter A family member 6 n=1 Tax=Talaromyces marneffei PM1 TaxID=1077442 RepID=A0A093X756_TALMA
MKRPDYQDKNVVPRLPQTRPRALTLQEPSQQTAGLLERLPIELRLLIYNEVLGHHRVHVVFEFGLREYRTYKRREHLEWRWWHCICTWDQRDDLYSNYLDNCRSGRVDGNPGPPNGMMGKIKLNFAILLTCRQIYSEAIDILYSTTTFLFATRQLLSSFPSLVLPHRFALISSIETTWNFVGLGEPTISVADQKCYYDMWAMLGGMPNLKRIRISVAAYECPNPPPDNLRKCG